MNATDGYAKPSDDVYCNKCEKSFKKHCTHCHCDNHVKGDCFYWRFSSQNRMNDKSAGRGRGRGRGWSPTTSTKGQGRGNGSPAAGKSAPSKARKDLECFKCGELGHFSNKCTNKEFVKDALKSHHVMLAAAASSSSAADTSSQTPRAAPSTSAQQPAGRGRGNVAFGSGEGQAAVPRFGISMVASGKEPARSWIPDPRPHNGPSWYHPMIPAPSGSLIRQQLEEIQDTLETVGAPAPNVSSSSMQGFPTMNLLSRAAREKACSVKFDKRFQDVKGWWTEEMAMEKHRKENACGISPEAMAMILNPASTIGPAVKHVSFRSEEGNDFIWAIADSGANMHLFAVKHHLRNLKRSDIEIQGYNAETITAECEGQFNLYLKGEKGDAWSERNGNVRTWNVGEPLQHQSCIDLRAHGYSSRSSENGNAWDVHQWNR